MSCGVELTQLKAKADAEGLTMSELGRRGGLKAAANRRRRERADAFTTKVLGRTYSDEYIQGMWWNRE